MSDIKTLFFGFVAWCEAHPAASTILATLFVAFVGWITGAIGWIVSKFSKSETSAGASAAVNGPNSGANVGNAEAVYIAVNDPATQQAYIDFLKDQLALSQSELKKAGNDKERFLREIVELEKKIANPKDYIEDAIKSNADTQNALLELSSQIDSEKMQVALAAAANFDYSLADQIFNEVVKRNEPSVAQLAAAQMGLGGIAEQQLRWQDAYFHYKRSFYLSDDLLASGKFAELAFLLGKYDEAKPLTEKLMSHYCDPEGEHVSECLKFKNNFAAILLFQGQLDKAQEMFEDILLVKRSLAKQNASSKNDLELALSLVNLGTIYDSQSRFADSKRFFNEAISLRRKWLPENHPDLALVIVNLAVANYAEGVFDEARQLFMKAETMYRDSEYDKHPSFAHALLHFGFLNTATDNYMEAKENIKEALGIFEGVFPDGHDMVELSRQSLETLYADHPELRD